ncbi:SDR family NAD(P)-dependent oxidoreductase [Pontibacter diazotrophicus]|uniref:SDR family NAD(P)-dependent oxidoreductase n=1 Tax=Pontibacter diazotrophicus TaxID=1400979 RepID=A0A3D8L7Q9_9BACT|nr:SDR family NAD(P)-dependent oxidoreductase [Pontibacter diazotrophicus]RDV13414.1 SDR family NAD(P)-dependent oxidoreductase [Pontibacter diazotrophicus]
MTKVAFVTGATSGIGRATAFELAKQGYRIIATGRRAERLEELKQELTEVPVYTLEFDVRDKEATQQAVNSLPEDWRQVEVLVNNAGNAHGLSSIQNGSLDDWDAMIDINVKGLLYVSHAVLPLMMQHKKGHIVNIGSIAGKEVYPNGNVYCASKHAVDAISQGMRIDLVQEGIRVSEVNPGLVETEFSEVRFKGDKERAASVYKGFQALQAQDIAEIISFIVTRPAHVNLAEVLVLPTAQAAATILHKQQ